jgi:glycosyltransferase involved in cell wall biosynthesis
MTDIEWPGWGTGLVNRLAARSSSVVCCNTQAEIDRYSHHFKIPRDKFRLVLMAFQSPDLSETRDEGYIFAGGNYGRDWKTLLEAVDGLPYPVRVFTTRTKLPTLPPNVTVAGVSRQEYYAQLAGSSCVVVPLFQEPLRVTGPTTWTNAMAMGKVVIVTEPFGAPDYMEHGVSGFYVGYGDAKALRQCIQLVMGDPELRRRVGQSARERAWREFSPEVFRRRILSILKGESASD